MEILDLSKNPFPRIIDFSSVLQRREPIAATRKKNQNHCWPIQIFYYIGQLLSITTTSLGSIRCHCASLFIRKENHFFVLFIRPLFPLSPMSGYFFFTAARTFAFSEGLPC